MPNAPMRAPVAAPPAPSRQEIAKNDERRDKRERARMKLDIFQTEVTRRAHSWMIAARMVGEAYKIADNNYTETLQKKAASDALEVQIIFSVLTVATSGALGWLSIAAAEGTKGLETAFRDAVESSLQATAGEVFSANGPLVFPPRGDTTVSQDPQVYQSELENAVDAMFMDVLQAFIKIRQKYLDLPLAAWDTYDERQEAAAHEKWQKDANEFAGGDDLPTVPWMAREIERGRWAKYVRENHSYRDFGIFQTADTPDDVGDAVRSRLEKDLGVGAAKVISRGPAYHRFEGAPVDQAQVTTKKLFEWAQKYDVRKFTDEKKKPKGGGPDHQ